MDKKELFEGVNYEGYYDETGKQCVDINIENVKKLIKNITGAKEVNIE